MKRITVVSLVLALSAVACKHDSDNSEQSAVLPSSELQFPEGATLTKLVAFYGQKPGVVDSYTWDLGDKSVVAHWAKLKANSTKLNGLESKKPTGAFVQDMNASLTDLKRSADNELQCGVVGAGLSNRLEFFYSDAQQQIKRLVLVPISLKANTCGDAYLTDNSYKQLIKTMQNFLWDPSRDADYNAVF